MSGPSVSDQADAIACSGGDLVDLGLQNVNLNDNVTIETTNGLLCKSASSGVSVSPQYGFFTEHATENSLAKHTYTRPDLLKVVQGEDGNVSQTIKKAFVNPQAALVTTGTYSSSGNSDQRVCGNGQFAQVAPPGTTIRRSHTNPEVKFPVADDEGNLNSSDFPEGYFSWGGTVYIYRRGTGQVITDSSGVGMENSDLACYSVPKCPEETKAKGGRCFCMGLDFTNGYPPSTDWEKITPCLQKVRCPDWDVAQGAFDKSIGELTSGGIVMWQYGSTEAFVDISHPKDIADQMEYRHGICNPMEQTEVVAATEFTKRANIQVDDISTLRDELSLEDGEIVEALEFTVVNEDGNDTLNCKYRHGVSPDVSQFGSGYSGSWVIDPALSNLSTLTEEEATKECSNIGYNSCGYSQYVNEGSRPQMQIEDGRSCEQLTSGEAEGVTCFDVDVTQNNVQSQCSRDYEDNNNSCGTCDNSILPVSEFAPAIFNAIVDDGAPPPTDPRSCRYARFFMEGQNTPLAEGQACSDVTFGNQDNAVPSTEISQSPQRACYKHGDDSQNGSGFYFPLYENQSDCETDNNGSCTTTSFDDGSAYYIPNDNVNVGNQKVPHNAALACDASSYNTAHALSTPISSTSTHCFMYGDDGTHGDGFYFPVYSDQVTCNSDDAAGSCTSHMFNSSMYFMPSIGSTKASPDVPTNNDIRLACTDATWVHSYGQHTEYAAVAQDGGGTTLPATGGLYDIAVGGY